jgi:Uncharacterised protein family (UPF0158)
MVTVKFSELHEAFEFASFNGSVDTSAFIDLDTGAIYLVSDEMPRDEDMPDDVGESDRYLGVPGKNELDLGRRLVMSFVETHLPKDYDNVVDYFRRRGGYAKFRHLLENRDVLDAWYEFENEATETRLKEWCEENEIQISFEKKRPC